MPCADAPWSTFRPNGRAGDDGNGNKCQTKQEAIKIGFRLVYESEPGVGAETPCRDEDATIPTMILKSASRPLH